MGHQNNNLNNNYFHPFTNYSLFNNNFLFDHNYNNLINSLNFNNNNFKNINFPTALEETLLIDALMRSNQPVNNMGNFNIINNINNGINNNLNNGLNINYLNNSQNNFNNLNANNLNYINNNPLFKASNSLSLNSSTTPQTPKNKNDLLDALLKSNSSEINSI